ncbi:MAG: UDP-N-acetylmuramoyl-L-alanine--D-glutamate ligase [Bacteroidales bacterium]|jgi:UDP-N-acetylmuramoylalanine--D-glutamate ligase|nr:UDP-N-acetylmuramoyl-L-alanine--D-glutamate ligase [Bacteroidales bacterium]
MANKRIVILGAGESGVGAAILATRLGFDVFVSDSGIIKAKYKMKLDEHLILFEEGVHSMEMILSADEIIKSPGIPDSSPVMQEVLRAKIPVISEIEFASRYTTAKKICITGSNGKTTTTTLIYYMMQQAGMNVGMAGNVGKSFALQVAEENFDYYVLELSSFQLEGMHQFKADIAIILNITPDHLDRYDHNLQNYVNAKMRILQNMTKNEYFIFCSDDEITIRELEHIVLAAQELPFGIDAKPLPNSGAFLDNGQLNIRFRQEVFSMPVNELSLKGKHNIYNSMAAGIAGRVLDIRKEHIRTALSSFPGVEHRLEKVLKIKDVAYINDSKATNINSTWYALECMETPVVWIAGGTDKGNDYSALTDLVKAKVHSMICLGVDNHKLIEAFGDIVPLYVEVQSMEDAVKAAYNMATSGDTVLLSPCCASFDLFNNYEDRGTQFKKYVREL